jgi:isoleucyl-tRNA synthetase
MAQTQDTPNTTSDKLYPQPSGFDAVALEKEILQYWEAQKVFQASVGNRPEENRWVFYEGPPSANGNPGVHHVMGRAIKDLFCRYQTLQGKRVERRAGWDTHGLPVELQVEKRLKFSKKDIGTGHRIEIPADEIAKLNSDANYAPVEADDEGKVELTVELYNRLCKLDVMKYTHVWDELTRQMGYWVDQENPYVTYDNDYILSVWSLLKALYEKKVMVPQTDGTQKEESLLYEDFTIQPYSPAAGTGLSSHELNLPGCYKNVKDLSAVVMFKWRHTEDYTGYKVLENGKEITVESYFLAWTTTPWTLPANSALAVGANIEYDDIETFNPYTFEAIRVVLASARVGAYFKPEGENADFDAFAYLNEAEKKKTPIPWKRRGSCKGEELVEIEYEPCFDFELIKSFEGLPNIWKTWTADFVTTEDGTGIVHIAPTFGADDFKLAQENSFGYVTASSTYGLYFGPIVNEEGRYVDRLGEFAGRQVKNYSGMDDKEYDKPGNNLDIDLTIDLKKRGLLFLSEKYLHNYPHCWRTDKPVIYYPLKSWFIRTTALKQRLVELNNTIKWKPAGTGTGRFGNWLENLVDWNLSRSRFWGIPMPIWKRKSSSSKASVSQSEFIVLDNKLFSFREYYENGCRVERKFFFNTGVENVYTNDDSVLLTNENINIYLPDLHKDRLDRVIIFENWYDERNLLAHVEYNRVPDLIDVWFDSGAMPYAQWGKTYDEVKADMASGVASSYFPADFIAEGVDQTRGWFFTLHAIAGLLFDSVAFKNVIANGLVLDKDGNKMSKRVGNVVDPFATLGTYGADATRWYMVENAPPWENLKFNLADLAETQRRFFGTLWNTYQFFALYANVDGFRYGEAAVTPVAERDELDRWVLSCLNTLTVEVTAALDDFDPTRAARAVQYFVTEQLSNWYVRLSRRRFWKGEMLPDKRAAYETLHECLTVVAQLISPTAPFLSDWFYTRLKQPGATSYEAAHSVHLSDWPKARIGDIDEELELRMRMAQDICSLAHGIRKKNKLKIRLPLQRLLVPVLSTAEAERLALVADLIAAEVNVKEVHPATDADFELVRKIKPDFKALGPRLGADIRFVQEALNALSQIEILQLEQQGSLALVVNGKPFEIQRSEVEITTQDIPGWAVATDGRSTVALDLHLTEELRQEGLARDLVNRLQHLRKDMGLEVTDRIRLELITPSEWAGAIQQFKGYICAEVLAQSLEDVASLEGGVELEIDGIRTEVKLSRV